MNVASQLAAVVEAGRADTAERRRLAEAATPGPWRKDVMGEWHWKSPVTAMFLLPRIEYSEQRANAFHLCANDPTTVLRLCDQEDRHYAAAEEILEIHKRRPHAHINRWCEYDGEPWPCSVLVEKAAEWGIS